MHPFRSEFNWPKLRRDLEEILAIIAADSAAPFISTGSGHATLIHHHDPIDTKPDVAPDRHLEPEPTTGNQCDKPDDLYDNAIVVLTEFGQASPAILQMWLSIDYSSAMTIMNRFQTEGLISSRGRVKHKAFSIKRSFDQ